MAVKIYKNWWQKLWGLPGTADCLIYSPHAHKYVSAQGIEMYRECEKERIKDFHWTEEAYELNDEINEMQALNLVKIRGNENGLMALINSDIPYTEYEYRYTTYSRIGKVTVPITHRRYGTDPNHSRLTGHMRDVTYKYHAFKIYTDKKGRRKVLKSPDVDNILEVASEYPYVRMNDKHTLIYSDPYTKDNQKIK